MAEYSVAAQGADVLLADAIDVVAVAGRERPCGREIGLHLDLVAGGVERLALVGAAGQGAAGVGAIV